MIITSVQIHVRIFTVILILTLHYNVFYHTDLSQVFDCPFPDLDTQNIHLGL